MNSRVTGIVSLTCFILTMIWLILYISMTQDMGEFTTLFELLTALASPGWMYYAQYSIVSLGTVCVVVLFSGVNHISRQYQPTTAAVAQPFVPFYATLALLVYLSQITLVPQLLEIPDHYQDGTYANTVLMLSLQLWPSSALAFFNMLAYAFLAVPSLVYGGIFLRYIPTLHWGGMLLILNGIACLIGFLGHILHLEWLAAGTLLGGVFFALATLVLGIILLRTDKNMADNHHTIP